MMAWHGMAAHTQQQQAKNLLLPMHDGWHVGTYPPAAALVSSTYKYLVPQHSTAAVERARDVQ